jgi:hypothetical protein
LSDKSNPFAARITTYFASKTTGKPQPARVEQGIDYTKKSEGKVSGNHPSIPLKTEISLGKNTEKRLF